MIVTVISLTFEDYPLSERWMDQISLIPHVSNVGPELVRHNSNPSTWGEITDCKGFACCQTVAAKSVFQSNVEGIATRSIIDIDETMYIASKQFHGSPVESACRVV